MPLQLRESGGHDTARQRGQQPGRMDQGGRILLCQVQHQASRAYVEVAHDTVRHLRCLEPCLLQPAGRPAHCLFQLLFNRLQASWRQQLHPTLVAHREQSTAQLGVHAIMRPQSPLGMRYLWPLISCCSMSITLHEQNYERALLIDTSFRFGVIDDCTGSPQDAMQRRQHDLTWMRPDLSSQS